MRIQTAIYLVIFFFSQTAFSQQPGLVNQTDSKGKKQGAWIKKYPNGNKLYEGNFKDDHPVGEFKRYYEDSRIKSVLIYSEDGKQADVTIYHPNGYVAVRGKYINQLKEGTWQFYASTENEYLISEEVYKGNVRNGLSVKFYPGKVIAEKVTFINGVKEGEWLQFHNDNKLMLRSSYLNGRVNGKFEVWNEKGQITVSGNYKSDVRDGLWLIYNEDGTIRYRLDYKDGITKDKQMEIDQSDFLDSLEKNKGKIPDPEITGII